MCITLLGVELRDTLAGQDAFLIPIIVHLLTDEGISGLSAPITVWERHLDTREVLPVLQQNRIEEPKAVIKDVFILWHLPSGRPQVSLQVITDVLTKVVPQLRWPGGGAGEEEEGEQLPQLFSCLHVRRFEEALPPLAIVFEKPSCEARFVERSVGDTVEPT